MPLVGQNELDMNSGSSKSRPSYKRARATFGGALFPRRLELLACPQSADLAPPLFQGRITETPSPTLAQLPARQLPNQSLT